MGEIENLGHSALLNWVEQKFFFALFKSHTAPDIISPFKLKMDEITKAVWLETKLINFLSFEYCLSKKISFKHSLTPKKSHLSIVYYQEILFNTQFNTWNLINIPRLNVIIILKVETALKEIIREISFKHCSSLFKPN